jgi:hypothetical protein
MRSDILTVALTACLAYASPAVQAPLSAEIRPTSQDSAFNDNLGCLPRIDYTLDEDDLRPVDPPFNMILTPLHVSGRWENRVDLTFFSDGCES